MIKALNQTLSKRYVCEGNAIFFRTVFWFASFFNKKKKILHCVQKVAKKLYCNHIRMWYTLNEYQCDRY